MLDESIKMKKRIAEIVENNLTGEFEEIREELESPKGRLFIKNDNDIRAFYRLIQVHFLEEKIGMEGLLKKYHSFEELTLLDKNLSIFMYDVYINPYSENTIMKYYEIMNMVYSVCPFVIYAKSLNEGGEKVLSDICKMYDALDKRREAIILLNLSINIIGRGKILIDKLIDEYRYFGMQEEIDKLTELEKEKENAPIR